MKASVNGTELYFDVDGMGLAPHESGMAERPVLFLLHGGPGGDHASFKGQLGPLRDVAQLVYIDHRGSGRSAWGDPASHTLDNNIDDVEALRQHLGLDRICLLGGSYGGMVAQGYAIRYPQRVSNLVLSVTAPSYRFMDDARRTVEERGTDEQKRVCQWLWEGTFQSSQQLYEYYLAMGPWYSLKWDREKFETSWRQGIRRFEQTNLGFTTFLRTFDYTEQLPTIACPTLVVAGAHDWICPVKHSRIIAEKIPRAHLKIFAHSSHSVGGDEPEAYLAALRGFLTYAEV
jgi:proline iminopeptidase